MKRRSREYSEPPQLPPAPPGPTPGGKPQPPGNRDSSSWSWSTDDEDCSPSGPPRPQGRPTPHSPAGGTHVGPTAGGSLPVEKGPFTLSEFVSKFGRSLPLCVSVEKGHHGDDERQSISMGEMYNMHIVKHTKVVELKSTDGTMYIFPLNSSVQFAPVFSEGDEKESNFEQIFGKVADVVAQKPLPRLIRATKTFTKDNKTLVEKNEVLFVQKPVASHTLSATIRRKRSLQVYSILHHKEKVLPGDCEGGFTADPYATRLYLSDLVSLFGNEFPLRVVVYLTDVEVDEGSDFPFHLSSEVSELTQISTETSLVASSYQQSDQGGVAGGEEEEEKTFINIPITLEIEVSIFQPDQDDEESQLLKRTKSLLQDFTTAKIHSIHRSSADLAGVTRKGYEREGVEIEQSDRIYDVIWEHGNSILNHRVDTAQDDLTYAEIESDPTYKRAPLPIPAPDQQTQSVTPPTASPESAPIEALTPHDTITEHSVGEGESSGVKEDRRLSVTQDTTYAEIQVDPTYERPPLPTRAPSDKQNKRVKPSISPKPAPRAPRSPYNTIGQASNRKHEPSLGEGGLTEVKDGGITQDTNYAEINVDPTYKRPQLPTPAPDKSVPPLVSPKPTPRNPPTHSNTFSQGPNKPSSSGEGGWTGVEGDARRKQSVDSAMNSSAYQPLLKPRNLSDSDSYVSLGPNLTTMTGSSVVTGSKSRQAMLSSAVPPVGDSTADGDLIRNLIGRIESLEQQVKTLTDKVEQLSNK